ncbi:MAG TPA: methyltransferase domain-containing protein [Candidatus Aminicenantes bacterium]|nr:methyltransferase domain-containing protein [Candidatus Aminicenantes bacterium]HRY64779.1 methyltransferase domain-containing protein [Candidatus Aminicenantes bacterium]HRZ71692.1 methyltransferase domain-containing protein [Candidatus Aminicenantes bacterium]
MKWYEALFADYAEGYDKESFTRGTAGECDFFESEIDGDRSVPILDIGCGTGRHAIEMARRGYKVTGVDLSPSQIDRARAKAAAAGVAPDFRVADARALPFGPEFGLAVMICEGAFPLMETDEMNFEILRGAARILRPRGTLVMTTLNGLFPLHRSVGRFENESKGESEAATEAHDFDLMTFRMRSRLKARDDHGRAIEIDCDERWYIPSELTWLLKQAGFASAGIFGARLGAFSRSDRLTPDDFEMLAVALKP